MSRTGTRHRARQYAVQVLFQLDVIQEQPVKVLPDFWDDRKAPAEVVSFTEKLVLGVFEYRDRLDLVLENSSAHWKVSRMAIVDRNVLRLALFEMLIEEGERVAAAAGVELHGDPRDMVLKGAQAPGKHNASMLQDVLAGRPTEVDVMNGAIVEWGRRTGVPTPLHQAVSALVKGLEHSWTDP